MHCHRLAAGPSDPRSAIAGGRGAQDAQRILEDFRKLDFLPANEAYRDEAGQALDRSVLVGLLGLPEPVMEPLAVLRRQWRAEPSVRGGKATAPADVG